MQLVKYEAAKRQLAQCVDTDEVKGVRNKSIAVAAYAKQAGDRELELNARALRLRAERRLGQLIEVMPKSSGGRPSKTGGKDPPVLTLEQVDIDKDLAKSARAAAKVDEEIFESFIEEHRASGTVPTLAKLRNGSHVGKNGHDNNEWYTPSKYIELAREVMGGIDLDPCSSEVAQQIVKAKTYYTIEDDGLQYEWTGRVWMNPPYGKDVIHLFVTELLEEYRAGHIDQACVLVNNATDTSWGQQLIASSAAVCFIRGRIKFLDCTGKKANTPVQGQMVAYFGDQQAKFIREWSTVGTVMVTQ